MRYNLVPSQDEIGAPIALGTAAHTLHAISMNQPLASVANVHRGSTAHTCCGGEAGRSSELSTGPSDNLVSIIVPTYNEADGLSQFAESVFTVLRDFNIDAEMVIVDDNSPDGTGKVADELAQRYNLRVLHRAGKLGLASAVVDGFRVARGGILGIMDADLSHAPSAIPRLVKAIRDGDAELAVGSRYVPGGGTKDWPFRRRFVSAAACWLARPFTSVHDATSGFLFMRRAVVEGVQLNPIGFKIGLEIIAKGHYKRCVEVPYVFRDRFAGESKFGNKEILAYLKQLAAIAGDRLKGTR